MFNPPPSPIPIRWIKMEYTFKITTLNIIGISSPNKIRMLEDFIHKQDLNWILLQEVTDNIISRIRGYKSYINIGTESRGTTIIIKECYDLTNIKRIPTVRGLAAEFNNIKIVNIYAQSGSERKRDTDSFFNNEVARLLTHPHPYTILVGDFNCVQNKTDCTGTPNPSRLLANLLTGLELTDVWTTHIERPTSTHYIVHL
jgi:exonuclease III